MKKFHPEILTVDVNEKIKNIEFSNVLSLFVLSGYCISETDPESIWTNLVEELKNELDNGGFPRLNTKYNAGRKSSYCPATPKDHATLKYYNNTNNPLLLISRILYIEKYKNMHEIPNIYNDTRESEGFATNSQRAIVDMTISEIIDLLKIHLQRYIAIYPDKNSVEHRLGIKILEIL